MKIVALGSNGRYQLGVLHNEDVSTPQLVDVMVEKCSESLCGVRQIANGGNHSLLLTENGDIHGTGLNTNGQLGFVNDQELQKGFVKLQSPVQFSQVACGWEFSVAVDTTGQIYTCGLGTKGELGLGPTILSTSIQKKEFTFTKLESFPPGNTHIVDVQCALNHTVVLLSDGTVWGWGASKKGQLGDGKEPVTWIPQLVFSDPDLPIEFIACGREYTVLGTKTTVKVLGADRFGVRSNVPEIGEPIKHIGSGWSSIHLHLQSGEVLSWGNNSHGQLIPDQNRTFSKIVVGSEHVLAIDSDENTHKVFAWGWGEHGNCGPQGLESRRSISLVWESAQEIKGLYAGQANGWIVEGE